MYASRIINFCLFVGERLNSSFRLNLKGLGGDGEGGCNGGLLWGGDGFSLILWRGLISRMNLNSSSCLGKK